MDSLQLLPWPHLRWEVDLLVSSLFYDDSPFCIMCNRVCVIGRSQIPAPPPPPPALSSHTASSPSLPTCNVLL